MVWEANPWVVVRHDSLAASATVILKQVLSGNKHDMEVQCTQLHIPGTRRRMNHRLRLVLGSLGIIGEL